MAEPSSLPTELLPNMDNQVQSSTNTKKRKSKSQCPGNSQIESHLLLELLMEILARLPAKTLLKIRCVSKTWRSIIDSSDFIHLHLKRYNDSKSTQLLAVEMHKYVDSYIFHIPRDDNYRFTIRRGDTFRKITQLGDFGKYYTLLGSCNGLLLMKPFRFGINIEKEKMMILWNPCIRKAVVLPTCPIDSFYDPPSYYLGFAPLTNDYKVLALKHLKLGEGRGMNIKVVEVAVYSLNDDVWRVKHVDVDKWDLFGLGCGRGCVLVGGVVYWIGCESFKLGVKSDSERTHLLSFDFNTEKLGCMQLPFALRHYSVKFIFLLGESVAVLALSNEDKCIWVLKKEGGEDPWRLWFSGESNSDVYELFSCRIRLPFSNSFYVQKSNKLLIAQWNYKHLEKCHKRLVMSYNISSNEIQQLGKSMRGNIAFDTYVESLVLHKGFDERQIMTSFPWPSKR